VVTVTRSPAKPLASSVRSGGLNLYTGSVLLLDEEVAVVRG
jgi:hypothetical protein